MAVGQQGASANGAIGGWGSKGFGLALNRAFAVEAPRWFCGTRRGGWSLLKVGSTALAELPSGWVRI